MTNTSTISDMNLSDQEEEPIIIKIDEIDCTDDSENEKQDPLYFEDTSSSITPQKEKPTCNICKKTFSKRKYVTSHMNRVHLKKFKHFCGVCSKGWCTLSELNFHIQTHHPEKVDPNHNPPRSKKRKLDAQHLRCASCDEQFPTLEASVKHEVTVCKIPWSKWRKSKLEKLGIVACGFDGCDEIFNEQSDLKRHINKAHLSKKEKTTRAGPLRSKGHGSSISAPEQFKCTICHTSFVDDFNRCLHETKAHRKLVRFPCSLCGTEFRTEKDCTKHEVIVCKVEVPQDKLEQLKIVMHTCQACDEVFLTAKQLKKHTEDEHGLDWGGWLEDGDKKGAEQTGHLPEEEVPAIS